MNKTHIISLFACIMLIVSCKTEGDNSAKAAEKTATTAATTQQTHPAQKATKNNPANRKPHATDHMSVGGMDWMTIEQAEKKGNKEGKKYLVDVYTDWCGWCKVMDKKTFSDPETVKYLEENFHVIKFNAEQKEAINFKGKTYEWTPAGRKGVNKLAVELLGSRMSYPTIVYLDKDMNKLKSSPGYKDPIKLMQELKTL